MIHNENKQIDSLVLPFCEVETEVQPCQHIFWHYTKSAKQTSVPVSCSVVQWFIITSQTSQLLLNLALHFQVSVHGEL